MPQPIFNDDQSILIMLEGRIFDYEKTKKHLINQGYKFKCKHSDAEYCLHLYEEMGENAFGKLNGCFVIAIYNLSTEKLLLVNDRFSSRPIFYYYSNEKHGFNLFFGTQVASILVSSRITRELDPRAIFEFFTFLFCILIQMI